MAIIGPTTDHHEIRYWAERQRVVPCEVLPHLLDSEPATLRILPAAEIERHQNVQMISWDEFFVKFDELGLTFVYDDDSTGYHEILQVEERNPFRHPAQKVTRDHN